MISGPVVSDTTPLINLAGIGLFDILPQLYRGIAIPEAVFEKYQTKAGPNEPELTKAAWLVIVRGIATDPLLPNLGAGERAAISLTKHLSARFILMDERKGRRIAVSNGLTPVGTLAVILRAKRQGLIPAVKPYVDLMVSQGRYLSEDLIAQILHSSGE